MTISATEPLLAGPYNGNGVTTVFSYAMTIFSADELLVFLRDSLGVETLQTLTTNYTVAPTGGSFPATGGTVTMLVAPPTGVQLIVLPDITRSQDRPFSSQSSITLQEVEDALDKLTAITRQLYERSLRAVTVSAFDPGDVDTLLANVTALVQLEAEIVALTANLTAIQNVDANMADINAAPEAAVAALASQVAAAASAAAALASENAAAVSAASASFLTHGLGITGSATLLANIDATNIPAGARYFDGPTTGTYPAGVVASDTGIVETWRQAAGTAMMELHHATTNRRFRRRMTASVWGSWREVIEVDTGAALGDVIRRGATDWERAANITMPAALAAAGQTTLPFSGVPAWVNRVTVHLNRLSSTGLSDFIVQIGDSGGYETTGYDSIFTNTSAGLATFAHTTGFGLLQPAIATDTFSGSVTLSRQPGTNTWVAAGSFRRGNAGGAFCAGEKTLSDVLTQVRVTTAGGVQTFDAGSAAISWE
jgi:hypothetical protein